MNNSFDALHEIPAKWIYVEVFAFQNSINITITDSGTGIPQVIQSKIMQPFFTTKEVGKGTGLGLSISKSIIDSHCGSLALDPSSQHTKFVITLPRRQPNTSALMAS